MFILGLVGALREGSAYDLSCFPKGSHRTVRDRLNEHIARGGRLYRSGNDSPAGGVGGRLVEQFIASPAADDVKAIDWITSEVLKLAQALPVKKRKTLQNASCECTNGLRNRL